MIGWLVALLPALALIVLFWPVEHAPDTKPHADGETPDDPRHT